MGQFVHFATQEAVQSLLAEDDALAALVTGVFDFVPAGTAFPYLTIGNLRVTDESTQTRGFSRVALTVNGYSRAKGRKEIDEVMECVHRLLHDADFAVAGHILITCRYRRSDIALLRDGLTFQAGMEFSLLLEHSV